jgi:SAM-dependent methyltransferase/methyltransferase-like protein
MSEPNSYDAVPYESLPFAHTHPARLAAVAALFGLSPPAVETARVLELGCAAGGNLAPMAEAFPNARFVGVDYSARQIRDGTALLTAAGITNVELKHASITDIGPEFGTFDYVVCHGVFSWVPREVQDAILRVCGRHLAPGGVAYVSYNTYPGWHFRGAVRDMMRYHALRFDEPAERVAQARALLAFLARATQKDAGAFGALVRSEHELLSDQSDHYLFHEQLEDVNEPLYFHQFAARAAASGLCYLGEAQVSTMVVGNFGADVAQQLGELASDQIQLEQYLDFVRNRTFRQTLLMRSSESPDPTIAPGRVRALHVACSGKPTGRAVDVASFATARFQSRSGMALAVTAPFLKAALFELVSAWPGTVPFAELCDRAAARLNRAQTEADTDALAVGLLNAYLSSDLIEFWAAPITFAREAGAKPVALSHARVRAATGHDTVSNRRHEVERLGTLPLQLLPLLDGTRDRGALLEATGTTPDELEAALRALASAALLA